MKTVKTVFEFVRDFAIQDPSDINKVSADDVLIVEALGLTIGAEVPLDGCKAVLFNKELYLLSATTAKMLVAFRQEKGDEYARVLSLFEAVKIHLDHCKKAADEKVRIAEGMDKFAVFDLVRFGHSNSPWMAVEAFAGCDVAKLKPVFGKFSPDAIANFLKFRSEFEPAQTAAIEAAAPADFYAYLEASKKFSAEWTGKSPVATEKDGDEPTAQRRVKPYIKGFVVCYRSFGKDADGAPRTYYMVVSEDDQAAISAVHDSMDPPKSVKFGSVYDLWLGASWLLADKKRKDALMAETRPLHFAAFEALLSGVKAEASDPFVPEVPKTDGRGTAYRRENGGKGRKPRKSGTHWPKETDARDEQ